MNAGRVTAAIGGFLVGGGVGAFVGMLAIEKKVRQEYNESLESAVRAVQMRPHTINVYGPVESEAELEDLSNHEKDTVLEGIEFDDENGNFKGHVTLVLEENSATFFMDGVEIKDWDERLGDSIVVDFYRLVPPNAPPILYVRNHKRDEDYEVTRELP